MPPGAVPGAGEKEAEEEDVMSEPSKKNRQRRAPQPTRRKQQRKKWWGDTLDVDPISLEPIAQLPYPPFCLESSGMKHYFDGKLLAFYFVASNVFEVRPALPGIPFVFFVSCRIKRARSSALPRQTSLISKLTPRSASLVSPLSANCFLITFAPAALDRTQ